MCIASKKKTLPGLDSMTSEGSLAFDTLEAAIHTIGSLGLCNCSNLSFVMKVTKRAWLSLGLINIGYNLVLYMQACLLNGLTAQLKGSDQPRYTLRPITSCMLPRKALGQITSRLMRCLPTRKTSTPLVRTSITLYVKDARIRSTAPGNY